MRKVLSYVKNNKGFTLIELLAVIVILAILMLVASTNVFNILDNARRGSFRTEFLSLLQAAQTTASMELMDGTLSQTNNQVCYSLDTSTDSKLLDNYSNTNDYKGSVLVTLNSDGSLTTKGWFGGNYYTITGPSTDKNGGYDDTIPNDADAIPATPESGVPATVNNCGGRGSKTPSDGQIQIR